MLIKMKLLELGKKQVDLLDELAKRGKATNPSQLSEAINRRVNSQRAVEIRNDCLAILEDWENERKG